MLAGQPISDTKMQALIEMEKSRVDDAVFLKSIQHVVVIGRWLGMVSRNDVLSKHKCKRILTIASVRTGFLALCYLINTSFYIRAFILQHEASTIADTLWELQFSVSSIFLLTMYTYFLFETNRFRNLVQTFKSTGPHLHKSFTKFCIVISCLTLGFGTLENSLFDLQIILNTPEGNSTLEYYFHQWFVHWPASIPYNLFLACVLIAIEKCGLWAWIYGDVFCIILAKAIAEKYRMLNNSIKEIKLKSNENLKQLSNIHSISEQLHSEFVALSDLTEETQQFIAPIILGSYVTTVYIVIINIFNWITPCSGFSTALGFLMYEFCHFFVRISTLTYFLSEVHHVGTSIVETIQECPKLLYNLTNNMLESFIRKKKLSTRSKLWIHPTVCLVTGVEQRHGDFPTGKNKSNTIFLSGLRLVIFIGRCLGIVSRNDVLRNNESERKLSISTVMSGCLAIFFSINAVLLVRATILRYQRSPSTSEKLGAFTLPGYACTMFFVYAYLFFATKRFRNIVLNFQSANQTFPTQFSPTFPRFCWLATIICLLFGVTENIMYDIQNLKRSASDKAKVNSTLEFYFKHTFYHWSELIPYHPVITVLYIIIIKCGTWGWVYGDVIAIILMRAIAEKFKAVNDNIKELILSNVKQTISGPAERKTKNDARLLGGLSHIVFIGRCLGIVSRSDVLSKSECLKTFTVSSCFSGTLAAFLLVNSILIIIANSNRIKNLPTISEKLEEISLPFYASTMFFLYVF
ncbi:unnamed protein product [Orchesella dallaii]|uniref:Gustatory receptor n=1 Tax=Orchesella dallaii TaxID=48710 RepID=A0ABP1S708_9HEXA